MTVKDGQNEESYDLECNVTLLNAGNNCTGDHPDHDGSGNGGKCHGEVVYSGHKDVLNIYEELETELKSPLIIESLKQEVENIVEPNVVESQKEEVEEPKDEIIEIPRQPEVIESLKENEDIQE